LFSDFKYLFPIHKTFPQKSLKQVKGVSGLKNLEDDENFEEQHKFERFLMFLCFLTGALIGYFLTNYVTLLGA